ncbi:putative nuclease HARBI1 [Neodiprion fabricii]|uniref:putative nuclease HARBI1 n=1 Tax=Neodiprion fabricii TaxID=2872261 RepID=UPI001ED913D5|nr:putative nuclease HARBI1 [Neodiprion fabricii]
MDSREFIVAFSTKRMRDNDSESSSSSDDMWDAALSVRGKRQIRPRIIGYNNAVACYTDHEFKSHFRMSRATFKYLHGMMQKDLLRQVKGCPCIPSQTQLMIALWKMATADSYRSICDRFNVGRATAVRAVRRVTRALFKRAPLFIKWPTGDNAAAVMRGFEESSSFPKVIGAIDGTHIRINAPKEDQRDYVNRKGYHSIHLQLVCDHRCLITHCYAGHPGSIHNQRVFRLSEVSKFLNDDQKFPSDSHLVGDATYELQQHLMTPFRDNGFLTRGQENYNYRHSAARIAVEKCIGLLKGRMRSLLHCLPMTRVDLMAEYIVACCVIHNICKVRNDEISVIVLPRNVNENQENYDDRQVANQNAPIQKRIRIMENLP